MATITLTADQKVLVASASKAASLMVQSESKGKAEIAAVKDAAKKALEVQRTELNLALKGLKESGFKMTGTMKNNPAKQALFDGFVSGGQEKGTAANSLSVVVFCYDKGYQVPNLNPATAKKKTAYVGLLDGKTIKVERDEPSCAALLIKAIEQGGFAEIALGAIKSLGFDTKGITKADAKAIAAFQLALIQNGYATAETKDGVMKLKATDKA